MGSKLTEKSRADMSGSWILLISICAAVVRSETEMGPGELGTEEDFEVWPRLLPGATRRKSKRRTTRRTIAPQIRPNTKIASRGGKLKVRAHCCQNIAGFLAD